MTKFEPQKPPAGVRVVLNWFEELKQKTVSARR
jgi:hypothetical protein